MGGGVRVGIQASPARYARMNHRVPSQFRLSACAAVLLLVLSALATFSLFRSIAAQVVPGMSMGSVVSIEEVPYDRASGEVWEAIDRSAASTGTRGYKVVPAVSGEQATSLVPIRLPAGQVLNTFDPSVEYVVIDEAAVALQDPVGTIQLAAETAGTAQAFVQELSSEGFTASVQQSTPVAFITAELFDSGILPVLLVALLALVIAAGYEVSRQRRDLTILDVFGWKSGRVLLRQWALSTRALLTGILPTAVIIAVALWLYNQWASSVEFLVTVAAEAAVVVLATVLVIGAFVTGVSRRRVVAIIARSAPVAAQGAAAFVALVLTFAVTTGLLISGVSQAIALRHTLADLSQWDAVTGYVAVNYTSPDVDSADSVATRQIARYAGERDRAGSCLLVYESPGGLVVNRSYLSTQGVQVPETDQPYVLAPAGADAADVESAAATYAEAAGLFGQSETDFGQAQTYAAGTSLFLFNSPDQQTTRLTDAIVVVTGSGLAGLPDMYVAAATTQGDSGDLLLADVAQTSADLNAIPFAGTVNRYVDVGAESRQDVADAQVRLVTSFSALLLAAILLVGVVSVATNMQVQRVRVQAFVHTVNGRSALGASWRFLLLSFTGLTLAAIIVSALMPTSTPWRWAVGGSWLLLVSTVLSVELVLLSGRQVRASVRADKL